MKTTFAFICAAFSALHAAALHAGPQVKATLRTSWPAPPFLTEILETVAFENSNAFFNLLELLTDLDVLSRSGSMTNEAIHQSALQIAIDHGILHEPGSLAVVEMNIAMHTAVPKLEAFYSYYQDHHNDSRGTHCGSWVDWYGQVVCDVETLAQLAGIEAIDSPANRKTSLSRPKILAFDHIFPPPSRILERPPRTAILYASLTSPNFRELHSYLYKLVNRLDPHVEYILRHIPPSTPSDSKSYLSGYGVALDLKKMDYLALDDRHSTSSSGSNSQSDWQNDNSEERLDPVLPLILAYPENLEANNTDAMSKEELVDLGPKAVQIVKDSTDPLTTLTHLSQNFPKYVSSLSRHVAVNESLASEIQSNGMRVQRGLNVLWLNGMQLELKDVNPLGLLRLLKKERGVMQSLTKLGLSRSQTFELLTHPAVFTTQREAGSLDSLVDASDRPEGGDIICWWNDMEKDSRYAKWNPSLFGLLRLYPGAMPNIKANLFNVILIVDLSHMPTLNFLAGPMTNIITKDFPLRFGIVPLAETEGGKKMAKLFYYLVKNHGRKKTLEFIKEISQFQLPIYMQSDEVLWGTVNSVYDKLVLEESREKPGALIPNLASIFKAEDGDTRLEKIAVYTERLGSTLATSPSGHAFFNGKHFDMNDDFLRNLQAELSTQMMYFQEKVYSGLISEENGGDSMSNYFYDLPTTSKRRNKYIYPHNGVAGSVSIVNLPEYLTKSGLRTTSLSYVYPVDSEVTAVSLYVIADLDSDAGLDLVKEALLSLTVDSKTRISFVHNPKSLKTVEGAKRARASWLFAHLHLKDLLSMGSPSTLLTALGLQAPLPPNDSTEIPLTMDGAFESLTKGIAMSDIKYDEYLDYVKSSHLFARYLHIEPGQIGLVVNGRMVGPIAERDFHAADFKALEDYEYRKRTEPIVQALKDVDPDASNDKLAYANLVSMASSIVASTLQPDPSEAGLFETPPRARQRTYQLLESNYSTFSLGDNTTAIYQIAALLDPLSGIGQKWSSLLKWLTNIPDVYIEVHLNPGRYDTVPIKRFYRYNLVPSLSFDNDGKEIQPLAVFEDIPVDPIYTLAMDVPTSWLVRPREALYDLDNIQLGKLFPGDVAVEAIFELDYIVIEGHARDAGNTVPRGVQVQLVKSDQTPIDDTQIVANLGYFQFMAKPGVSKLEIREGRGREIFRLESAGNEGWGSPTVEEAGAEITVTSFDGLTLYPRLVRLPGMEKTDVLEEEEEEPSSKGLFDDVSARIISMFKSRTTELSTEVIPQVQADINIFTVASGLLYERFVGIMILSVLRNTNSTVKFWFIENFLSPSFLEFIPHMAEKYNFQYELVTYKWPSWLRAQTEKQRIIWAYKILFLDVLFPMDLKKVIFVDADQIVRADLKELVDLDLQGAPYGYTPMGDDNTDMEGFRFWKMGYWKEFLRGKPYHISALYVIDLVRFKQLAAGDILRGQYQQLSADPNSLANLDQDLPNNIQQLVPIFSLHEDWLWCETWCSKDRLHRAKTIDLCQNPLTKEPKLARARQIPEWEEYDTEIARFTRALAAEGKIHSRIATADSNVLAGAGAGTNDAVSLEEATTEDVTNIVVAAEEDKLPSRDEL